MFYHSIFIKKIMIF
uniref:Uncharacterized protein n=1 Tax=Arundo donax TaxID=35708 RepID=A0A0A8YLQ8_ARUDO